VTGKIKEHLTELVKATPENVVLTNFVPEEEYVELLRSVDVIIDLTTREDCLVCGAYEAVAAGKPLIASDTKAMRTVFNKGVLYTKNTADDIAEKIGQAIQQRDILGRDIIQLREHILGERVAMRTDLERLLLELEA
jgi:glycosyltransferase involved in cell wall biosynthesis